MPSPFCSPLYSWRSACPGQSPQASGERWSYREKLLEGVSFIRRDALLLPIVATVTIGILLVNAPLFAVMLPVFIDDMAGSPALWGTLIASFAVGALAGASLSTAIGHRLPKRRLWIGCFIGIFTPYIAIGLSLPLITLYPAMAIFGLAEGLSTPLYAVTRYRRIPKELRGRVFSSLTPVTGLVPMLGVAFPALLFPILSVSGVALVLLVPGVALVAWLVLSPVFRLMDTTSDTEASPSPGA